LNEALGLNTIRGLENGDAARQADICVLTVVATAHQPAVRGLVDELQGKIVVDATARVDFRDPRPPEPPAAARTAQDILGKGARVVAAFQNVPAHALRKNLDQPLNSDVIVCADDVEAAEQVVKLANAGSMRAYYAGGLDNAIIVEGLTALLIGMNKYYGTKTATIGVSGIEA
jgi:NADPH-dependent F420 reductase